MIDERLSSIGSSVVEKCHEPIRSVWLSGPVAAKAPEVSVATMLKSSRRKKLFEDMAHLQKVRGLRRALRKMHLIAMRKRNTYLSALTLPAMQSLHCLQPLRSGYGR